MVGKICFALSSSFKNRTIRHLIQNDITTVLSVVFHWSNCVYDIPWKSMWSLTNKYLIMNKVKEVSFKLLHRVYPVNVYIKIRFPEKDPLCSFCVMVDESVSHLFWNVPM